MRYRTIVADPPWPFPSGGFSYPRRARHKVHAPSDLPYTSMPVDEIAALPIAGLVERDAHLYLWATNAQIEAAYMVARAWGFAPSRLLTWCKNPAGLGLGGTFSTTTEFILFSRRGSLPAKRKWDSTWWLWKRPYLNGTHDHSRKPDAFLDLVEATSPGPYVELFARRQRLGWDTWGDEALNHVEIPA